LEKASLEAAELEYQKKKPTAELEFLITRYVSLLSDAHMMERNIRQETKDHVERKQVLTSTELPGEEEEDGGIEIDADSEEEDEEKIYNPLKLPLGWDGKPIPFWLYKLHGLGIEYPCEICGGFVYMGRKAFERHFQEYRHAHGMQSLGIPNSRYFQDITSIADAYARENFLH
jgi:splicing factor 3A subunit 3